MAENGRRIIWNLPNSLSLFRIGVAPLLILFMLFDNRFFSLLAALTFLVASLTDWLDGYFARKYSDVSVLGKFLDPVADKLLVATSLIMLVSLARVPAWMVALIIGRKIAITGLRSIAVSEGVVIPASNLGKVKTLFQISAIIGLIIHYPFFQHRLPFHRDGPALGGTYPHFVVRL